MCFAELRKNEAGLIKKPLGGQVVKVKTSPEQNLTLLEMAQTEEMITMLKRLLFEALASI